MEHFIDIIFHLCALAAMVGLTTMLLFMCGAVIYGVIRSLFNDH